MSTTLNCIEQAVSFTLPCGLQVSGETQDVKVNPAHRCRLETPLGLICHSLLRSRTIADGAAAGLIVFITEASAFCFCNLERSSIFQAAKAMFVKLGNGRGHRKKCLSLLIRWRCHL